MFARSNFEERRMETREAVVRAQSNRMRRLEQVLAENARKREERLGHLDERLAALRQRQLEVARLREEHLQRIHEQAYR